MYFSDFIVADIVELESKAKVYICHEAAEWLQDQDAQATITSLWDKLRPEWKVYVCSLVYDETRGRWFDLKVRGDSLLGSVNWHWDDIPEGLEEKANSLQVADQAKLPPTLKARLARSRKRG